MNSFYRNKVTEINGPIKFQVLSWEKFDEEISQDEIEYKIYMFGVTDSGESISVRVDSYTPYFYVKIPNDLQDKWKDFHTKELKSFISKKLYSLRDSLVKVSVVEKKELSSFTNEKQFKFLKIITKTEKCFKKCRYILSPSNNRPKPVIPAISSLELEFDIYEANIEPFIRFCHIQNVQLAGWCQLSKYKKQDLSRCQIDISCKWTEVKPLENVSDVCKLNIASFDIECMSSRAKNLQKNIFPDYSLQDDVITQIGVTFHKFGTNITSEYMCTLNSPIDNKVTPIDSITTEIFETEIELINGFVNLIRKTDPDVITGYNINSFDWNYIHERVKLLNIENNMSRLSRLYDYPAYFKEDKLITNAYGENTFKYYHNYGMLNSDLFTIVKREQKLVSYKLDHVAEIHIGDQKDPLSPLDIFNKSMGTADEVATVIRYCAKDCTLVINLIKKLCIITNLIGMANVTFVPIEYIENRGQQIKVHSQLLYEARLNNYLVPTLPYKSENDNSEEEKFTGATVLDAHQEAHFEQISGLDFASLYPSIMIANNFSYETMVKDPKYDNLENVEYKDIIWTEDEGKDTERVECVRFVQNKKGILPIMLEKLWTQRKAIKKEMKVLKKQISESTDDKIQSELRSLYEVKDGFQLAMKVSMNSIYGFTGARFGRLPEKRIAAAVTATGRGMIKDCKSHVEEKYNCKVVYGDTDSIYVKFSTQFTGQEHMEEVFRLSEVAAESCSNLFKKPIDLEFEKVMWPFILFSKKRYACVIWTNTKKHDYIDYKGIQVVRRDNCPLIKQKSMRIFEKILLDRDIPMAVEMARDYTKNLLEGNYPIKDLIISKSLKGRGSYEFDKQIVCKECCKKWYTEILDAGKEKKKYRIPMNEKKSLGENILQFISTEQYCHNCKKDTFFRSNEANIAHVALARKMEKRDPYNCPLPGERVPYVFKETKIKNARQFELVEDPNYLIHNCIPIDYNYYFEHQLKSALDTIFEPILKEKLYETLYSGIIENKSEKLKLEKLEKSEKLKQEKLEKSEKLKQEKLEKSEKLKQ